MILIICIFIIQLYQLVCSLCTCYFIFLFFNLLSNNLLVGGIPYLGFGILLLPNFCGGNLHVPDVTY